MNVYPPRALGCGSEFSSDLHGQRWGGLIFAIGALAGINRAVVSQGTDRVDDRACRALVHLPRREDRQLVFLHDVAHARTHVLQLGAQPRVDGLGEAGVLPQRGAAFFIGPDECQLAVLQGAEVPDLQGAQ
jgi:hypothetical protein